jgi:hypothetical protein
VVGTTKKLLSSLLVSYDGFGELVSASGTKITSSQQALQLHQGAIDTAKPMLPTVVPKSAEKINVMRKLMPSQLYIACVNEDCKGKKGSQYKCKAQLGCGTGTNFKPHFTVCGRKKGHLNKLHRITSFFLAGAVAIQQERAALQEGSGAVAR